MWELVGINHYREAAPRAMNRLLEGSEAPSRRHNASASAHIHHLTCFMYDYGEKGPKPAPSWVPFLAAGGHESIMFGMDGHQGEPLSTEGPGHERQWERVLSRGM